MDICGLEKEMATHASILAWEIPQTEKPGGLYSPWGRKRDTTERLKSSNMWLVAQHRIGQNQYYRHILA